jgi:hypothetical protein
MPSVDALRASNGVHGSEPCANERRVTVCIARGAKHIECAPRMHAAQFAFVR